MTGHQQIIEARRGGMKPGAIFVVLGEPQEPPKGSRCLPGSLAEALYRPEAAIESGQHPVVYLRLDERPDLRFVLGCSVHVSGRDWTPALIELGHALAEAGAIRVVVNAITECPDLMIFDQGKWTCA